MTTQSYNLQEEGEGEKDQRVILAIEEEDLERVTPPEEGGAEVALENHSFIVQCL